MKKILLILICLIFTSGLALAEHGTKKEKNYASTQPSKMKGVNIYKSGFYSCVNGKFKHSNGTKVKDPKNTILIIYNHGGGFGQPSQSEPERKSRLRATCGLGGIKIGDKTTIMWNNKKMGGGGKWGGARGPGGWAGPKGTKIWQKCQHLGQYKNRTLEEYEKNRSIQTPENNFFECIMTDYNAFKRFDKTVELVKMFIKQGVPPKQIFLIGISAGGWDAMRMAGLYGNGELINGGISIDPCPGYWMYPPGNIYWFFMSEVKNKYKRPLPVMFMGMNSTDCGGSYPTFDDRMFVKDMGGQMVQFPEYDDVEGLKSGKEGATEFYLDGVPCKINKRAERGIGKYYKGASGHAFFFSACFPHYHPQIIDFITKKLQ